MADFTMGLTQQITKQFMTLQDDCIEIFERMTQAGADVAMANIIANVPEGMRKSAIMGCLKKTRTYRTPTDNGINTKVGFYGYFKNENGKKTAAPLVAIQFEYGRSEENAPYPKQPFLRKSFDDSVMKAMLDEQKKASGGLLG